MNPQRVHNMLGRVLRRVDPDDRLRAYAVWSFWAEEVGETIATHAYPIALRAAVLTVAVDSPTWLQELQFLKDTLRERINTRLGQALIDDIYFVSASRSDAQQQTRGRKGAAEIPPDIGPTPAPLPTLRDPAIQAAFARIIEARARRARRDS